MTLGITTLFIMPSANDIQHDNTLHNAISKFHSAFQDSVWQFVNENFQDYDIQHYNTQHNAHQQMTFSIMPFIITTLSVTTFFMMKLSKMKHSILKLGMTIMPITLSLGRELQFSYWAELRGSLQPHIQEVTGIKQVKIISVIMTLMLSVVMLNVFVLSVGASTTITPLS